MADATHSTYLTLSDDADQDQRQALVMKLEWEPGVEHAVFDPHDAHRLRIDYDPEHFSELTLLDAVRGHGWQAEIDSR